MTNEEFVLVALSGLPLDVAAVQYYTGLPFHDLWVVLEDLLERGLVTEVLSPCGVARPMRFRLT